MSVYDEIHQWVAAEDLKPGMRIGPDAVIEKVTRPSVTWKAITQNGYVHNIISGAWVMKRTCPRCGATALTWQCDRCGVDLGDLT